MPTWKNVFVNPRVRSLPRSVRGADDGLERQVIGVSGLICHGICVRRAKEALEGVSGVRRAVFLSGPDRFEVECEGDRANFYELEKAVLGRVVAPGLRRALDKLGQLMRPRDGVSLEVTRNGGEI